MFQSLPNLYEQVNSELHYGNLDFNFNVDAEIFFLDIGRSSSQDDSTTKIHFKAVIINIFR